MHLKLVGLKYERECLRVMLSGCGDAKEMERAIRSDVIHAKDDMREIEKEAARRNAEAKMLVGEITSLEGNRNWVDFCREGRRHHEEYMRRWVQR